MAKINVRGKSGDNFRLDDGTVITGDTPIAVEDSMLVRRCLLHGDLTLAEDTAGLIPHSEG